MIGQDLLEFCIKRENRAGLHPELRAEIDFGLENSKTDDLDHLSSIVDLFLARSSEWDVAEADIIGRRNGVTPVSRLHVEALRSIVSLEVGYQYDLWREDYSAALDKAASIVDKLSGDRLAGYRALWNYFAGCAAYHLGVMTDQGEMLQTASDRFLRASRSGGAIVWFAKLSLELDSERTTESRVSLLLLLAADSIDRYLATLGTVGKKFPKTVEEYHDLIQASAADKFDRALTELGRMLGFDADKPKGQGAPDSVWKLGSGFVLLFESKSDETPSDGISIRTCRQAQGHQDWQTAQPALAACSNALTIIISPRQFLDKQALPHAEGLFYLHIKDVRSLFSETEACLRPIRSRFPDLDAEKRLRSIQTTLSSARLTPSEVVARLTGQRLSELDTLKYARPGRAGGGERGESPGGAGAVWGDLREFGRGVKDDRRNLLAATERGAGEDGREGIRL